jgi:hypothetical protein
LETQFHHRIVGDFLFAFFTIIFPIFLLLQEVLQRPLRVLLLWPDCWHVLGGPWRRPWRPPTNPADSLPGTIRGDLCVDVGRNVCHGSDSVESATKELVFWFKPEELVSWASHSQAQVYE